MPQKPTDDRKKGKFKFIFNSKYKVLFQVPFSFNRQEIRASWEQTKNKREREREREIRSTTTRKHPKKQEKEDLLSKQIAQYILVLTNFTWQALHAHCSN